MASLVNRRGTYYVCWTDATRTPSQRRLSLRTRDKGLARTLLGRADAAYRLGQFDPWVDGLEALDPDRTPANTSLEGAEERYLTARADDLKPLSVKRYRSVFRALHRHLPGRTPLTRIKARDLSPFVLDPGLKPNTQRTRRTLLRAFFSWCVRERLMDSNPAVPLRQPKHDVGESIVNRRVTEAELDLICREVERDHERRMSQGNRHIAAPRRWLVAVFRFAYYTGLRGGELARLRWEDVDVERRQIVLHEQKSGQVTVLPISNPAVRVLESIPVHERDTTYVFRNPIQRRGIKDLREFGGKLNAFFVEYRDSAGIERPITLHGLRHGFCTRLAEAGVNAFTVQAAARHSDVRTSQTYVSLSNEALRESLDAAFAPGKE